MAGGLARLQVTDSLGYLTQDEIYCILESKKGLIHQDEEGLRDMQVSGTTGRSPKCPCFSVSTESLVNQLSLPIWT